MSFGFLGIQIGWSVQTCLDRRAAHRTVDARIVVADDQRADRRIRFGH